MTQFRFWLDQASGVTAESLALPDGGFVNFPDTVEYVEYVVPFVDRANAPIGIHLIRYWVPLGEGRCFAISCWGGWFDLIEIVMSDSATMARRIRSGWPTFSEVWQRENEKWDGQRPCLMQLLGPAGSSQWGLVVPFTANPPTVNDLCVDASARVAMARVFELSLLLLGESIHPETSVAGYKDLISQPEWVLSHADQLMAAAKKRGVKESGWTRVDSFLRSERTGKAMDVLEKVLHVVRDATRG